VSLNAESRLVTSVIAGRAKDYDGHKLKKLVEKDLNKGTKAMMMEKIITNWRVKGLTQP
jgi:hypothetical protein